MNMVATSIAELWNRQVTASVVVGHVFTITHFCILASK